MVEPMYSPWGTVDHCKMLCYGAFEVQTARHGGVMILRELADEYLSKEAQAVGFIEGRYLCFEEDCDSPVAIRELLDKGLMKAPVNQYYKEGEYSATIDDVIAAWHTDYLQAVEARKAAELKETPTQPKQKKTRSREER
jgi:hypothetical protein